ncbi:hypothetical protein VSR01_08125 [Actinacidiphila sp. DG2A-62]|uniref:hypothetical protein n=1 Tax=Actinacidiphila sp. DG2A-62 TaxID=3108821 RepID=UPI002DB74803|nr:hypothetical protein [Actinacidiphila sp. DG2A-62]MEC3993507.1 hypothetical protein [Actinacidiphila sp. DG2A-62]
MVGVGRGLRAVRAAVFAALCVVMSGTTHVLLSREPLPLPVIAAVAASVFAVAYALGGRERGYTAIAAVLIPLELASDTLFNAGQRTCYGPGGGPVTGSWRSLHEAIVCQGGGAGASLTRGTIPGNTLAGSGSLAARTTASAAAGLSVSPWLLLAAHVAVGLAAALLLRSGEAWLHRSLRTVFRPLLVALAALAARLPERRPARPAAPQARLLPALPLLLHSLVRRGPPVLAA